MSCDPVLDDRTLVAGDPVVRVHVELGVSPTAAGQAGAIVASALTDTAALLPAGVVASAQLVARELGTNAILHARSDLHVGLVHDGHTLLVAVADAHPDDSSLQPLPAIDFEESCREMTLIASVADDFGWRPRDDASGKIMWVLLHLEPAAAPPSPLARRRHRSSPAVTGEGAGRAAYPCPRGGWHAHPAVTPMCPSR